MSARSVSRLGKTILLLIGVLVYLAFAGDLRNMYERTSFYVFQSRDLNRAMELLAGNPVFFGPEMTGGGNLPGPLYYLLLGLSLALSHAWQSAWLLMIGGLTVAGAAGWAFFNRRVSVIAAIVWLTAFATSNTIKRFVMIFLNVSYTFPFLVLALIAFALAFSSLEEKIRNRAFVACAFLVGLCLQLHFSVITVFIALLLTNVLARLLKVQPVPGRVAGWAVGAFLLPSVPYLLWLALARLGLSIGQKPFNPGEATGALPSLIHMLDYITAMPIPQLVTETTSIILQVIPAPLMAMAMAMAWLTTPRAPSPAAPRGAIPLRPLAVCAAVSFLPFSYWFFATIGMRYGAPFFLALSFLTALLFQRVLLDRRWLARYVFCAGAILPFEILFLWRVDEAGFQNPRLISAGLALALPLATAYGFEAKARLTSRLSWFALAVTAALLVVQGQFGRSGEIGTGPLLMPRQAHWRKIWSRIYGETRWPFEVAASRIYFINHHLEQDARLVYDEVRSTRKLPAPMDSQVPDGYFVAYYQRVQNWTADDFKRWLYAQNVQKDVVDALKAGDIEIPTPFDSPVLVVPYFVRRTDHVPRHFHNYGLGYATNAVERELQRETGTESARVTAPGRVLFKWNECPDANPFCTTGAIVNVSRPSPGRVAIKVDAGGAAISQVSPWISPNWTQQWVSPFLEVRCGPDTRRWPLATSIGYGRQYASDPGHLLLWGNNSFVAPFSREFELDCASDISEITLGRMGSKVETIYKELSLPGRRLTVKL